MSKTNFKFKVRAKKPRKGRDYDPQKEYVVKMASGKWAIRKYRTKPTKPNAYAEFQKVFTKLAKDVNPRKTKSGTYQKLKSDVWKAVKKSNRLDVKGHSKKAVAKKDKAVEKFLKNLKDEIVSQQIEDKIEKMTLKGRTPSDAEKIEALEGVKEAKDTLGFLRDYFGDMEYTGEKSPLSSLPESFWWNFPELMKNILESDLHNKKDIYVLTSDGETHKIDTLNAMDYADILRDEGDKDYETTGNYGYMTADEEDDYILLTISSNHDKFDKEKFEKENGYRTSGTGKSDIEENVLSSSQLQALSQKKLSKEDFEKILQILNKK